MKEHDESIISDEQIRRWVTQLRRLITGCRNVKRATDGAIANRANFDHGPDMFERAAEVEAVLATALVAYDDALLLALHRGIKVCRWAGDDE